MSAKNPWAGILDPDEKILWQGRPVARIKLEFDSFFEVPFFLFFTGFSVFWMLMASRAPGPFWMFGLLFFGVGSYNLLGKHFWKAYKRRHMFYSLSNKRAFIATNLFGKKGLKSYPITADTTLELGDATPGDIWFAQTTQNTKTGTRTLQIGFELLEEPRKVYGLMRQIQTGEETRNHG